MDHLIKFHDELKNISENFRKELDQKGQASYK